MINPSFSFLGSNHHGDNGFVTVCGFDAFATPQHDSNIISIDLSGYSIRNIKEPKQH
jgi:hypothetical protein